MSLSGSRERAEGFLGRGHGDGEEHVKGGVFLVGVEFVGVDTCLLSRTVYDEDFVAETVHLISGSDILGAFRGVSVVFVHSASFRPADRNGFSRRSRTRSRFERVRRGRRRRNAVRRRLRHRREG
jgi:hypothetical protein